MNTKQRLAKLETAASGTGRTILVPTLPGETTEQALELAGIQPDASDRVVFVTHYGGRIDGTPQFNALAG
ncbi:MAG: hypothetical protein HQL37_05465 [Alphaproteobacteria bacterium]|nr:hypothetical protein [Alphaproteobacteria bacterium]